MGSVKICVKDSQGMALPPEHSRELSHRLPTLQHKQLTITIFVIPIQSQGLSTLGRRQLAPGYLHKMVLC